MNLPKDDDELFPLWRTGLFSAVIGDVMDLMGYQHQFLPPEVQPLRDDMVLMGRAMPVLEADDYGGEGPGRTNDLLNRPSASCLGHSTTFRRTKSTSAQGRHPTTRCGANS